MRYLLIIKKFSNDTDVSLSMASVYISIYIKSINDFQKIRKRFSEKSKNRFRKGKNYMTAHRSVANKY